MKCQYKGCNEDAKGYVRSKMVCNKHFKMIQEDNKRRMRKNKITSELKLLEETEDYFSPLGFTKLRRRVMLKMKGGKV